MRLPYITCPLCHRKRFYNEDEPDGDCCEHCGGERHEAPLPQHGRGAYCFQEKAIDGHTEQE